MAQLSLSDKEIQSLFGHEAAEDEDPVRLREYYFKSNTYDQTVSDLSLRILVGHKGIGKSALFQVSMWEDEQANKLPILIKPDDILDLKTDVSDFLQIIRNWKNGLLELITKKVLFSLGADSDNIKSNLKRYSGIAIDFLRDTFKDTTKINYDPAKKIVVEQFLKTGKINVYIDDLDRGWQGRKEDIIRISALLNAVRDITKENRGISFKISLRSDVYFLVRTADESTDKIEGSVIWQSWNNHEILVLLIKRIETYFGRTIDENKLIKSKSRHLSHYLHHVMEPRFTGLGHWARAPMHRVLMSLIRKRPRDLVKLCTLAARNARETKSNLIKTIHFENIFEQYSQGRLQDTINEFRSELPDLGRLLMNMRPSKKEKTAKEGWVYRTDALLKKIQNIKEQGEFLFSSKEVASNKELASFLYKINFLTARKEKNECIIRKYFEESRYLSNEFTDFGFDWEVHPAYRWALQPRDLQDIYRSLKLDDDDGAKNCYL